MRRGSGWHHPQTEQRSRELGHLLPDALEAVGGIDGAALREPNVERFAERRALAGRLRFFVREYLKEQIGDGVGFPEIGAGEHSIGHEANRPYVRARTDVFRASTRLLGRHVERRAHDFPGRRDAHQAGVVFGAQHFGDPEVHDLRHGAAVVATMEKYILGLQVPMHDARRMGLVETTCNLQQDLDRLFRRERPASGEQVVEVFAVEQLHHDERSAVELGGHVRVGNANHVLAGDARGSTRLASEASGAVRAQVIAAVHHLEGPTPTGVHVLGEVDASHAASSELADDAVAPRYHSAFCNRHNAEQGSRSPPLSGKGVARSPRKIREAGPLVAPNATRSPRHDSIPWSERISRSAW